MKLPCSIIVANYNQYIHKTMKKQIVFLVMIVSVLSCNSDDDNGEEMAPETNFEYTQEEKDAEIEWIKSYIEENELTNVQETASGLHYIIEQQGDGLTPNEDDNVIFHFKTSNTRTGEILGVSNREENQYGQPFAMQSLLEGVREGLLLVNEGSVITMIVPSYLGYGKYGSFGGEIEPETILTFTMELNIVLRP